MSENDLWEKVRSVLRSTTNERQYNTWLEATSLEGIEETAIGKLLKIGGPVPAGPVAPAASRAARSWPVDSPTVAQRPGPPCIALQRNAGRRAVPLSRPNCRLLSK